MGVEAFGKDETGSIEIVGSNSVSPTCLSREDWQSFAVRCSNGWIEVVN